MSRFEYSEARPVEIAVKQCALPFGFDAYVRADEQAYCFQIIVHTSTTHGREGAIETLFARGDFDGRSVLYWRDDPYAFKRKILGIVRDCSDRLMDLVVDQEWFALGELLGAA